jgi:hypothetical protein
MENNVDQLRIPANFCLLVQQHHRRSTQNSGICGRFHSVIDGLCQWAGALFFHKSLHKKDYIKKGVAFSKQTWN